MAVPFPEEHISNIVLEDIKPALLLLPFKMDFGPTVGHKFE